MRFRIISVGKLTEPFYKAGVQEYLKRLQAYGKFELTDGLEVPLPPKAHEGDIEKVLSREAAKILGLIGEDEWVVTLDIQGKPLTSEAFAGKIGENSFVKAPLSGAMLSNISIGNGVYVNSNLLAMARGGIVIEDDVQIAANVQLITNNHDFYERQVLTCRPIVIKKGAWIGAGATILPGITIGRYAVVGAASVVTHDVGDCEVVAGNPAKCIRRLEAERFEV